MRHPNKPSSKNTVALIAMFLAVFWLLYLLASLWHEDMKITREVEIIQRQNQKAQEEIEENKKWFDYLETPESIEKAAKTQLGKKRPGERVLFLVEEDGLNLNKLIKRLAPIQRIGSKELSVFEKWQLIFWGVDLF